MSSFDAARRQTLNSRINCIFRKLIALNRDTGQPHTAKQKLKSVRPMSTGAHFDPTNVNPTPGWGRTLISHSIYPACLTICSGPMSMPQANSR